MRLCHVIHDEIVLEAPEDLAPAAADLLLDVMQDPGLKARYLKNVLRLVADVRQQGTQFDTAFWSGDALQNGSDLGFGASTSHGSANTQGTVCFLRQVTNGDRRH